MNNAKLLVKAEFSAKRRAIWTPIKSKMRTTIRKKTSFEKKLGGKPTKNRFRKGPNTKKKFGSK